MKNRFQKTSRAHLLMSVLALALLAGSCGTSNGPKTESTPAAATPDTHPTVDSSTQHQGIDSIPKDSNATARPDPIKT
jgi:PBP1b-binding outer membrane lipoprotein LpoB